jgi:NH3-dependent NAD+ synthetase
MNINPEMAANKIEDFIRNEAATFQRDGVVLGMSGFVVKWGDKAADIEANLSCFLSC